MRLMILSFQKRYRTCLELFSFPDCNIDKKKCKYMYCDFTSLSFCVFSYIQQYSVVLIQELRFLSNFIFQTLHNTLKISNVPELEDH